MLLHGSALSKAIWRGLGYTAALEGHTVVRVDLRGHGRSGKPHDPECYRMARHAGDVLAVLDTAGISRAHVVGYSSARASRSPSRPRPRAASRASRRSAGPSGRSVARSRRSSSPATSTRSARAASRPSSTASPPRAGRSTPARAPRSSRTTARRSPRASRPPRRTRACPRPSSRSSRSRPCSWPAPATGRGSRTPASPRSSCRGPGSSSCPAARTRAPSRQPRPCSTSSCPSCSASHARAEHRRERVGEELGVLPQECGIDGSGRVGHALGESMGMDRKTGRRAGVRCLDRVG
ncbi:alpha/beta fold hydrolase [Sinomonas mesophila]|uniref:alpha/beta fold hydrolase n=1 Tax=Sinomonas mesophila TaxID=1531955 RepID=UPI00318315D2